MRLTAAVLGMFSTVAIAADSMKPGLWEMTMKSDQLKQQQQMPELSPAQREQMQKLGMPVPTMRDGAVVHQVCITKEYAARSGTLDPKPPSSECKLSNQNRSGSSYRAEVTCDGPNLKGTGTMKGTFSGDTSYASTYEFKGTSRGKPVTQQHETTAKWLRADCGNVKPMADGMGNPTK